MYAFKILLSLVKTRYQSLEKERESILSEKRRLSSSLSEEATSTMEVEEVGFIEIDEFEGSSPDGLIHIGDELTGVEFKCPQDNTYAKLLFDKKIKPEYYAQMQMQMMHTGAKRWFYCVYNPNFDEEMIIIEVLIDKDFQEKLKNGLDKGKKRVNEILEKIINERDFK